MNSRTTKKKNTKSKASTKRKKSASSKKSTKSKKKTRSKKIKIFIKENKKNGKKFIFPSNPEEVKITFKTRYKSYSILAKSVGDVKFPNGMSPAEVSFDGYFFGEERKSSIYLVQNKWTSPNECEKLLYNYQKKGTTLRVVATNCHINYDMTISDFQCTDTGGHGDKKFSITFTQHKDLKIHSLSDNKKKSTSKKKNKSKTNSRNNSTKKTGSYTIKSGDTLWAIARRRYGSGIKWTAIYKANKSTLDAVAKKHGKRSSESGHWIYAGTKITIPNAS